MPFADEDYEPGRTALALIRAMLAGDDEGAAAITGHASAAELRVTCRALATMNGHAYCEIARLRGVGAEDILMLVDHQVAAVLMDAEAYADGDTQG